MKRKFYPVAIAYQWPKGYNKPPYMGKLTGERREPLKGEWYLWGSPLECLMSPGNLNTDLPIVEIVRVKVKCIYKEIKE